MFHDHNQPLSITKNKEAFFYNVTCSMKRQIHAQKKRRKFWLYDFEFKCCKKICNALYKTLFWFMTINCVEVFCNLHLYILTLLKSLINCFIFIQIVPTYFSPSKHIRTITFKYLDAPRWGKKVFRFIHALFTRTLPIRHPPLSEGGRGFEFQGLYLGPAPGGRILWHGK